MHAEPRVVGPGFHARVYEVVRRVPRGKVATYGQIATLLGSPRVARQVGWALAACGNADEPVPWHRIINAKGSISHRGDTLRAQRQRELLEREGIEFRDNATIELSRYRWDSSNEPWPDDPVDPDGNRSTSVT